MRVSRAQAEENRQNVIDVASRLFREHGFDGIGLKDLMEGAGMTQGAFYKQFEVERGPGRRGLGAGLGMRHEPMVGGRRREPERSARRGDRVLPVQGTPKGKNGGLPDRGARRRCRKAKR